MPGLTGTWRTNLTPCQADGSIGYALYRKHVPHS